jgi:hypothetical protein
VLAKLGELIGVGDQRNSHSSALIAAARRSRKRQDRENAHGCRFIELLHPPRVTARGCENRARRQHGSGNEAA